MSEKSLMGSTEWIMLLSLSVLWGGSFFFMKISLVDLPTFSIVFMRVFLAALTLLVVIKLSGASLPWGFQVWKTFIIMGFINNLVPFSLLVWGMTEIASGLAAIINATTPIFAIIVAHFYTSDERISANKIAGILLGICGVVILIGFNALNGFDDSIWAMMACLGAALSYGFAASYGKNFATLGIKPTSSAFGQVTASSCLLLPIALIVDSPWTLSFPSTNTWMALLALGTASTAFAYVLFFRILATAGATNIALVTLLVPVSAILLGWLILDEALSANHFVGTGLIAAGLLAIDGRLWPARKIAI